MTPDQFRQYRKEHARKKRRARGVKPRRGPRTPEEIREYHNEYMRQKRAGLIQPRKRKPPKTGWRKPTKTHGHAGHYGNRSATYSTWAGMKQRCLNPKHKAYKDYGGRGITFDPRWADFQNFLADIGEKPAGLTLERTNNALGYSKDNCCWATRIEQANNQRRPKGHWIKQRELNTVVAALEMLISERTATYPGGDLLNDNDISALCVRLKGQ